MTIPTAESTRMRGIRLLVVGISNNINLKELQLMSSQPQAENVTYWRAAEFAELDSFYSGVTKEACNPSPPAGEYHEQILTLSVALPSPR